MSGFLDKTGLAHLWEKMKSALSLKQDKLTAGTGITIADDGTISASGGSSATRKLYYVECKSDLASVLYKSSQVHIEEITASTRNIVKDGRIKIYLDALNIILAEGIEQCVLIPLRIYIEGSTYGSTNKLCVKAKVTLNADAMTCTIKIDSQQFCVQLATGTFGIGEILAVDLPFEYKVTKLEALN
nr:MAG TPA: hypothetical protein [Caudoviricetes sp.]